MCPYLRPSLALQASSLSPSPQHPGLPFLCLPSCLGLVVPRRMPSRGSAAGATEVQAGSLQDTPISAPAKCARLLVSIRHKQVGDQDAEGSRKLLCFGSVAVGCTAERLIELYNPSVVRTGPGGRRQSPGTSGLAVLQIHPLYRMHPFAPHL